MYQQRVVCKQHIYYDIDKRIINYIIKTYIDILILYNEYLLNLWRFFIFFFYFLILY